MVDTGSEFVACVLEERWSFEGGGWGAVGGGDDKEGGGDDKEEAKERPSEEKRWRGEGGKR